MVSTGQLLKEAAQSWQDKAAITDMHGTLSYHELYAKTQALKQALLAAGLSEGQGLGVMGRNGRAFVAAMFAGMDCGAVVLPISHQLKSAEVTRLIHDTGLHAVLDDQSGVQPVNNESVIIPFAEHFLRLTWVVAAKNSTVTPLDNAAFIRYTSGTTGVSKGVVLTHQSILQRVELTQKALQLTPEDTVLWVLPMAFHFLVTILVYIRSGSRIIVCKDMLAQTIIQTANQYQASLLYASPMHYRLLAADLSTEKMPTLKCAISTSAGLPANIAESFERRFQLKVRQAYGIIELGLPLMDNLSGNSGNSQNVGFPVDGFAVELWDDNNQPVAEGESGRLAIRGVGMFDAYLKPWQLAAQVMHNGWFITGDLAVRQADGRIIISGREKSMINVSGNKAFPEEIEAVLEQYDAIESAHVFSVSHALMGEIVAAEVVMAENISLDVEAVLKFCRTQLSTYKIPQRLKQVKYIEQTQSGKLRRYNG